MTAEATLERPRTRYKCPLCGNDDGAAGIRKRTAAQRGDWNNNRWWVECRKCQGTSRDGDYLKLLAAHLKTNPPTLLRDARRLLREAGLLLDSNTEGKTESLALHPDASARRIELHLDKWPAWHKALLKHTELHSLVGGTKVIEKYGLMLITADQDRRNRSALAWPVYQHADPVCLVRRYFSGKVRYANSKFSGMALWPDVAEMPADKTIVLVAGMRDACWARAAGVYGYTTTAGVGAWSGLALWAPGRDFLLAFDRGESQSARSLGARLFSGESGARSVRFVEMPKGVKDLAELGERRGLPAIRKLLKGAS